MDPGGSERDQGEGGKMNEARQKIMAIIGESGCYLLSIVHLAEGMLKERLDAVEIYLDALANKYMQADCFILEPAALMAMMVPGNWTMMKADRDRPTGPGELEILRYERKTTLKTYGHFVVGNGLGAVAWDPLGDALTVNGGELVSKRLFRRV